VCPVRVAKAVTAGLQMTASFDQAILQSKDDSQIPKVRALSKDLEGLDALPTMRSEACFPSLDYVGVLQDGSAAGGF
jgi:hypothetical protein